MVATVLTDVLTDAPDGPDRSTGGPDLLDADADFFADLGGDSLLATKVVARLREYLAVDVPLRLLFEQPSASALPLISTSTVGLPSATTISSNRCCNPVRLRCALSPAASELPASPCSPSISAGCAPRT